MSDKTQKFLKSIEFQENFPPFKNKTEIKFDGEDEVQNMIEFYLKNKGVENYKENAKRFKINCVLGNNGGGKSTILESILYDNVEINNGKLNYFNILDNFLKLNFSIQDSVNHELFSETGYSRFYCNTFNFLNSNPINKKIFSSFLNLNEDYKFSLNYEINRDWYKNFGGNFLEFMEYENSGSGYSKNAINDKIDFSQSYKFFKFFYEFLNGKSNSSYKNILNIFSIEDIKNIWLHLSDLFIATINNYGNIDNYNSGREIIFNNHTELFLEKLDIILFFLDLIEEKNLEEYYIDIGDINVAKCKIKENLLKIKNQIENLKKYLDYLKNDNEDSAEKIAKIILGGKKKYGYFSFELQQKLNKDQSSTYSEYFLLDLIYDFHYSDLNSQGLIDAGCIIIFRNLFEMRLKHDIFDTYLSKINKNIFGGNKYFQFSQEEIEFLKFPFFKLDINFIDGNNKKSFECLSAGEKTMLTRFTNIHRTFYGSVIPRKLEKGNTALILIDEPDLHLHLDWQRQYIQKLIDVFSTLDSKINLHFIIATHSPFIISDLPTESMIILDKSEKNIHKGEFVEVKEYSKKDKKGQFINQTFGANYIDIIKNGFFFQDKMLMGSFAQENIEKASKKLKAKLFIDTLGINEKNFEEKKTFLNNILEEIGETKIIKFDNYEKRMNEIFDGVENIQNHIGDDFLQDNLMYLN